MVSLTLLLLAVISFTSAQQDVRGNHNIFRLSSEDSAAELQVMQGYENRNAVTCGVKYFIQVLRLGVDLFKTLFEGEDVFFQFVNVLHSCHQDTSGFFVCVSQGLRGLWERSEKFRQGFIDLSLKGMELFENIYKCMSPLRLIFLQR